MSQEVHTVYVVIFAVVLSSQISRVSPSRENFSFKAWLFIHSLKNITKIVKLSPPEFAHLHVVQNCENICTRNIWRIQYLNRGPCD